MSSSRGLATASRALKRRPRLARSLATAAEASPSSPTPPPPQHFSQAYAPVLPRGETTGAAASEYLSSLLSLPPSAAFPDALALQILTHKSYRFVHRLAHPPPYSAAEQAASQASHNSRLGFIGRRAIAAYGAMFLHSAMPSSEAVRAADFLGDGRDIETKLAALRHQNNLGRFVGDRWKIGEVMRWDQNETGREGGYIKIKGLAVEAVLGGLYATHGSPAAHRAYHLHVLPLMAQQLRDPALIEAAERAMLSAKAAGVVA